MIDEAKKKKPKSLVGRMPTASQMDGGEPLLLSVPEAAARLRVGNTKLFELIKRQRIRTVKLDGLRRVVASSLQEYVDSLES
jgi:excisionase family DNA binding protein